MFKNYRLLLLPFLFIITANAQKNAPKKYPSLLWEITGNGLKKPSYLFGTMHVSSKMAFHLSDSFYYAIKSADAVALELNPDVWQGQMARMDKLKTDYGRYTRFNTGSDYLTENSFRIKNYDDELKLALSTEPTVVNSLLYRSFKQREDFEEDTFLDLYIYQTGRKLGKRGTGVENYYETEKIVMQAYADMAAEKKKRTYDTDGESMSDISEKIENAYKRGDLDLMDSLDNMMEQSVAFREKFLYLRNEIQANSMDSIMKKSSLFVGVGSAHLPGPRGVIELLRRKGYTLRPVKMADRDAVQKDAIDNLKVPVVFNTVQSADGVYKVDVPGQLYDVAEDYNTLDRKQYSDMSNGSFYQITRIRTHSAFVNQNDSAVIKRIDSLLYENIPGKIVKKTMILKSGYKGYDIKSKTRRGDLQRYHIMITPFEIIIFKMSGKEGYIDGKEGTQFFSSITLKEMNNTPVTYLPPQGGFTVKLPQQPSVYFNTNAKDGNSTWEYEAVNSNNGNAYLLQKKSLVNFDFLDEDTFELKLLEEAFRSPDYFERQLQRKPGNLGGYPCLEVLEKMKDSSIVTAKYIIAGPHYYVLAAKGNESLASDEFFNSFRLAPYKYTNPVLFADTFMHFTVLTPLIPNIDTGYRAVIERISSTAMDNGYYSEYSSYSNNKSAFFSSDSTGESVAVNIRKFSDYYFIKDSAAFWKDQFEGYDNMSVVLTDKKYFQRAGGISGYTFGLRDTGSSKKIDNCIFLKNDRLYSLVTVRDTLNPESVFINNFFSSFTADDSVKGRNIFVNPLDTFFTHLLSADSATAAKAQKLIAQVHFGEKDVPRIMEVLKKIPPSGKNYFDIKTKLIAELGFIKDSTRPVVVENLKLLYDLAADTSTFQNEVLEALAMHRTKEATAAFKEMMLEDPVVYDNSYSYNYIFRAFEDTLPLAAQLYPDILQLASLDDYKEPVMDLLVKLVDSGFVKAAQYESWFSKIFFDAKIELKKQKGNDEKKTEAEKNKDDNDDMTYSYTSRYNNNEHSGALKDYAVLLAPFYDQNANVPRFFEKLLQSRDEDIKLNTAIMLLKNKKPVPDSLFNYLASLDRFRGSLYTELEEIKRTDKFPAQYKNQRDLARSYMLKDKDVEKVDSVEFVGKEPASYNHKNGFVYFFKYRVKKEDDWKIGIGGLQPENEKEVSSNDDLSTMTDKKITDDKPVPDQFKDQLKKILFAFHPSARNFYESGRYGDYGY